MAYQSSEIARLRAQQEALDKQLAEAKERETRQVLIEMVQKMREYGISLNELMGRKPGALPDAPSAKYRDPASGATWSGRGASARLDRRQRPQRISGRQAGRFPSHGPGGPVPLASLSRRTRRPTISEKRERDRRPSRHADSVASDCAYVVVQLSQFLDYGHTMAQGSLCAGTQAIPHHEDAGFEPCLHSGNTVFDEQASIRRNAHHR